jgi:hypothetical protein
VKISGPLIPFAALVAASLMAVPVGGEYGSRGCSMKSGEPNDAAG